MFVRSYRSVAFLAAVLVTAAPVIRAEEGMWTFDNPPLKQLAAKYNFHPTQEWLDHLRLSSVRLNDGGSGSSCADHLLRGHAGLDATSAGGIEYVDWFASRQP